MYRYRKVKSKKRFKMLSVGIFLVVVMLFSISGGLKIKQIDCYTQFGSCRPEIISTLTWLKNYSIYRPLPTKQILSRLNSFSDIKNISVHRRLPKTVVVSILLRNPAGLVGTSVLGAYSVVDDDGYLYQETSAGNYPILVMPTMPPLNTYLDKNSIKAMKSLALLSNLTDRRVTGVVLGESLVASISGETQTFIGLDDPIEKWYPSLQLILNRSKMRGKMPRKIDLRFDSSVITY